MLVLTCSLTGWSQCTIDNTQTVAGIYPSTLPDATVGTPYSTDVTFVFLKDTSGLTIYNYHIVGMSGLPIGINWTCNASANNCNYDPAVTIRGCINLSGTPIAAGTYHITTTVDVSLQLVSNTTVYNHMDLVVQPSTTSNSGFSMTNSKGCAPLTVTFINNIPGLKDYVWNFGNGFQSVLENPPPVTYSTPGTYVVTQSALVDTFGYYLTDIKVTACTCYDPFSATDLYVKLVDGSSNLLLQTPYVLDQDPPVDFPVNNLALTNQTYTIHIWDDDQPTSADDDCGQIMFNGHQSGTFTYNGNLGLTVQVTIYHPTTTVTARDTVYAYPVPTAPVVSASGSAYFCKGDSVMLGSTSSNVQWYKDTAVIIGATSQTYAAQDSATYFVVTTNQYGCTAISNKIPVTVYPNPPYPNFTISGNVLTCPSAGNLQWYLNGSAISGATSHTYTISTPGNYNVVVTNSYGCSTSSSTYYLTPTGLDDLTNSLSGFEIYPNPSSGEFTINFQLANIQNINLTVSDMLGKVVYLEKLDKFTGNYNHKLDLPQQSKGVYLVEIDSENQAVHKRVIVK